MGKNTLAIDLKKKYVSLETYDFQPLHGARERHVMIHISSNMLSAQQQIENSLVAYRAILQESEGYTPVFRRIFLSDAANQVFLVEHEVSKEKSSVATSIIEQPPLDGTKIAIWVYLVENIESVTISSGMYKVRHGAYTHYWSGTSTVKGGDSESQTVALLSSYADALKCEGLSLENHCIRTWFFVQNVDVNYWGVVKGRNRVFDDHDLTSHTHFISSTGIGGCCADKEELVQMNAYAVGGLQPNQIQFLYAKNFLNSTYEYGVRFERGTRIEYGDRVHLFISGTASIDNRGDVVHVGDVRKQVIRMWENVEALLNEGGCDYSDVAHMIVYLRDLADFKIVKDMFDKKFSSVPKVFLLAPVCRPTWLVEMECMAVKEQYNSLFGIF